MRGIVLALFLVVACGPSSPSGQQDSGVDTPAVPFNVTSAQATDATHVTVTFDAAPNPGQAASANSYSIPGLTVTGAVVDNATVTLETSTQDAISYTVTANVHRASDFAALTTATAMFGGKASFNVAGATSTSSVTIDVMFDSAPNATAAATASNYTIAGLAVSAASLNGNVVTLTTAGQQAIAYTLDVANVTRDSDGEPLTVAEAQLQGTPVLPPTVTNVVVTATNPDNGTTAFNTGTATVTITGTEFETVSCPTGVSLDDLDGAGTLVGTHPTTCTVDSGRQITATFPSGIRTNAATGWNVLVTNAAGSNTTSDVAFVPHAGLVISEVYTGTSGATDHEYLEVYNPTQTAFDPSTLKLHVRSGAGADTNKQLTQVTTTAVPPHGFLLIASSASDATDVWFAHEDMTFSAALVGNGGAYISLSNTKDALVIDKVGWGTQPAPGFEGTAPAANIASNQSVERLPAQGLGAATDTDDNSVDFTVPSTTITPKGTADAIEPPATFNVVSAVATSSTSVTVTFDGPPDPTAAVVPTNYTIAGLNVTAASLAGDVVTLTTQAQSATTFTLTVTGVNRLDGLPLTTNTATFSGITEFDVTGATSQSSVSVAVTFSDPPDPTTAQTATNYTIAGLAVSAASLSGSTVTLTTGAQTAAQFTVVVSNVTRASDGQALTTNSATFTGTGVVGPTVTNVVVASTSPDNGTTPFNTGTTTVTITGTDFDTVACPGGVKLDDLDGAGTAVGTAATSCTVDSSTQITATFPAGIRTNAATGWNVIVTNTAGSNPTSDVKLVPRAGLLISEVMIGSASGADHEYLEVYNPTANAFDGTSLKLHIRNSTGTSDVNKALTAVTAMQIPSHGFLLLVSSTSTAADAWFSHEDATYSQGLVSNGGAYISLSTVKDQKVLDRVGWGTQVAPGFEGTATTNLTNDNSIERLPAGGAGHATDTDNNAADFNPPSPTLTPRGTADAPQP